MNSSKHILVLLILATMIVLSVSGCYTVVSQNAFGDRTRQVRVREVHVTEKVVTEEDSEENGDIFVMIDTYG